MWTAWAAGAPTSSPARFGSLSHELLIDLVGNRVADGRVLQLLRQMLTAGVLRDGVYEGELGLVNLLQLIPSMESYYRQQGYTR